MHRDVCYTCNKVRTLCVCVTVPKVQNKTFVSILQHPRERRHPIGTARLARLGLQNMQLRVCHDLSTPAIPADALLFPSEHARELTTTAGMPKHLVVLDGTWSHAKSLYRQNPWLQDLPHYSITPDNIDRYKIRKEPKAGYTSTLEATIQALRIIEPETPNLVELLHAFERMIAAQVSCIDTFQAGSRRRRQRSKRPLLATLKEQYRNAVVVYGEFAKPQGTRELMHWTAVRLGTGEHFEAFVQTSGLPTDAQLQHMGITQEHLAHACSRSEFETRWQAFCQPNDVIVAWNHVVLSLLQNATANAQVILKTSFCNWRRGACGSLQDVVAAHALSPELITWCQGRAQERLANAVCVLNFLCRT